MMTLKLRHAYYPSNCKRKLFELSPFDISQVQLLAYHDATPVSHPQKWANVRHSTNPETCSSHPLVRDDSSTHSSQSSSPSTISFYPI